MFSIRKDLHLCTFLLLNKINFINHAKRKYKSWKVMFFGTDQFSLVTLQELFECLEKNSVEKLEVVSMNENSTVSKYAISKKLTLHFWPPTLNTSFDIGVVVSFGKLIPKAMIDYFPLGILNVHGSLLPQYRGANPIFHAIKNGDSQTGITIMKIKPYKFDTGDIVMQESCKLGSDELFPYVTHKVACMGAKCLRKTIENLPHSLSNCIPQSSELATSAPKVHKSIGRVKWEKSTATEIYNLYRGLFGQHKLSAMWNAKPIKLICISRNFVGKSKLFDKIYKLPPGSLEYCNDTKFLRVHCLDKPLYICTVQVAHKLYRACQFYKGYMVKVPKEKWIFE